METAVVDRVMHDHAEMNARLTEWEAALDQVSAGPFFQTQVGLRWLWQLVPFFETQVPRRFRQEETDLFPRVEASYPGSGAVLARFSGEHAEFLRQWHAYRVELLYADAVGETRRVCELGSRIIAMLRLHMKSEERELLPLAREN
jgi:hemerythrin-like domain-containing protein